MHIVYIFLAVWLCVLHPATMELSLTMEKAVTEIGVPLSLDLVERGSTSPVMAENRVNRTK